MTVILVLVLPVFLVVVTENQAGADIYRYVDKKGVVNFTDSPGNAGRSGYEVYLREDVSRPLRAIGYYPYRDEVRNASSLYKIDEPLLRAVMEVESDYNRFAISSTGARGLMQLMPDTMRYLGVRNPYDPKQSIMAGARYLKGLMGRFSGNISLALAAYNAGAGNVVKYGQIPPFPQTQRYVMKVMTRYRTYSGIIE
ncbi:MAG TPA: DUF4124 domain-containing protein [Proteobacteria bacterium]|nr:DUF4124 domain-containing protein [Pseudomonadota bacterium]